MRSGIGLLALWFSKAAEESIHERRCMNQGFQRAKCRGLIRMDRSTGRLGGYKICPVSGDERLAAIRQDQKEKQPPFAMHCPQNAERFAFERMARTDNCDCLRKVLMMGSVSYVPSILFHTPNF